MKAKLKIVLKLLFNKPIYRIDILNYVLTSTSLHQIGGLCGAIMSALNLVHITEYDAMTIFPLFNLKEAKKFGAEDKLYWWTACEWNSGRKDYLLWLINQYKDDKEDIRKFQVSKHI